MCVYVSDFHSFLALRTFATARDEVNEVHAFDMA